MNTSTSQIVLYTNSFGQEMVIPVLRHKGSKTGSKIVITCLNHGNEIIGSMAAIKIFNLAKNNKNFAGELVVLTCLNQGGVERGSRFFEADNFYETHTQNLNRNYGSHHNSLTGLVADKILDFIVAEQPDLVIDCHSYSIRSLVHIILDRPDGVLEQQLIELATNSNIPFYLEYEAQTLSEQKLDYCLSNQLLLKDILAITIELGPQFGFGTQQLNLATQALRNLVFGEDSDLLQSQNVGVMKGSIFHRHSILNDSQYCGILEPLAELGASLAKGTPIANIYDFFGQQMTEVVMPQDGIILVWCKNNYTYPKAEVALIIIKV